MKVTLVYEVDEEWVKEHMFTPLQVASNLAGAARKGFNSCYGGLGTKGTDFIKLESVTPNSEKKE